MAAAQVIVRFLHGEPVITLFLVLGLGYLLGRIRVAGISAGSVTGTLLVSLVFGNFGFRISPGAQAVGFALFMFAVGYQAGPRFIDVLKTHGVRYFVLSLFIAVVGFAIASVMGALLSLPPGGTAGLFAGALTTTPALAASQEAVHAGLAKIPEGWTAERVIASIGTSYAVTYIVGMFGMVLILRLLPRIARVDLPTEAKKLEAAAQGDGAEPLQARGYRVENEELLRESVARLSAELWGGLAVVRLRRDGEWVRPAPEEQLRRGDEVYAFGSAAFFRGGIERLGPEIPVVPEVGLSTTSAQIVVVRPEAVGRTLSELDLARRYELLIGAVHRDGLPLPAGPGLRLERGDVLTVVGPPSSLREVAPLLGPVEPRSVETDMTTFAFGIAIGSALGLLSVTVFGVPLKLGAAGGLLIAGLFTGWLNGVRPTVGRFPEAARWILMEFGLLVFMAAVGLNAGSEVIPLLRAEGPALVLASVLVVSVPALLGYVFGRKVLHLNPVLLLGAVAGAATCAPGLGLITSEAKSPVPALGYTGCYAFANIILAVAGTLLMLW